MSTPDPVVATPKSNAKKWLVGCLLALVLVLMLVAGAVLFIAYQAKKQVDAIKGDAQHLAEDARRAAAALGSGKSAANDVVQTAEARMRLGRAAASVVAANQANTQSCPPEAARNALPVDAEWFGELVNGLPGADKGTLWMRDPALVAAASDADQEQALIALDKELQEAGAIAVVHSTGANPSAGDGKATTGRFEGFVQLVGYPDGETMCTAAFHADGDTGAEFQKSFWAAEEAALGK